jgi:hypothetical protein
MHLMIQRVRRKGIFHLLNYTTVDYFFTIFSVKWRFGKWFCAEAKQFFFILYLENMFDRAVRQLRLRKRSEKKRWSCRTKSKVLLNTLFYFRVIKCSEILFRYFPVCFCRHSKSFSPDLLTCFETNFEVWALKLVDNSNFRLMNGIALWLKVHFFISGWSSALKSYFVTSQFVSVVIPIPM